MAGTTLNLHYYGAEAQPMAADGEFELRFDRAGVIGMVPPADFREADWDLGDRVVAAVRHAIDPPTVRLPIQPTTGVEDTQPISVWFVKP